MDTINLTIEEFNGLFENLAYNAAHESLGVYPKAFDSRDADGNHITIPRTEKQDGWNDCVMAFTDRLVEFEKVTINLPVKLKIGLAKLTARGCIFFFFGKKTKDSEELPIFAINCNDTFGPCADCEEFELSELQELLELYDEFGPAGTWAFANMKRNYSEEELFRVSAPSTRKYNEATELLKSRHPKKLTADSP